MDVRSSFWSSLIFGIAFGSTWPSRTRSANKPWSQESWHFANSRWTRFCVISGLIWKTLRAYRRRSKARKMRTSAVLVLTSAVWLLTWASGPKRKSFLRNAKYVWRSNRICRSDGARQDPRPKYRRVPTRAWKGGHELTKEDADCRVLVSTAGWMHV